MGLTEKQLEERRHYIGGSDVGAILGFSKWKTALDVYFEKVEGKRAEINNNFIYWGNQLEPLIRNIFTEVTGLEAKEVTKTKYHKDYPFIAANIDGLINIYESLFPEVEEKPKGHAILEIKTVSQFARSQWGKPKCDLELPEENTFLPSNGFGQDDGYVPMSYLCQTILYAAVYEIEKVYLAVYFGNDLLLQIYQYNRDLELEKQVLDKLIYFWRECVEKEIPPDPSAKSDIDLLYGKGEEDTRIVATNEILDIYYKAVALKKQEKEIKEQIEKLKIPMQAFMKENIYLLDNTGERLIRWGNTTKGRSFRIYT